MAHEENIRLSCGQCDSHFELITEEQLAALVDDGWRDVSEFQSYEDATAESDIDDPGSRVMEWYTHLATCPDCAAREDADDKANRERAAEDDSEELEAETIGSALDESFSRIEQAVNMLLARVEQLEEKVETLEVASLPATALDTDRAVLPE